MACAQQSPTEYLRNARKNLVTRMKNLPVIIENLYQKNVFNDYEIDTLKAEKTEFDKARCILDWVINKGEIASYELLRILDVTQKRTLPSDLRYWISCFPFRWEDTEASYSFGTKPCQIYQTQLKMKAKNILKNQRERFCKYLDDKAQVNFSFISLVLETGSVMKTQCKIKLKNKKCKKLRPKKLRAYIPNEEQALSPEDLLKWQDQNILIIGKPGVGKTTVVQEMLRCWAEKDNRELDYQFYFDERVLPHSSSIASLQSVLFDVYLKPMEKDRMEVFKDIEENSDNVVIVFDGVTDLEENSILWKIMNHELLPDAKIVITCRSEVEDDPVFSIWPTRKVYVQGFSEESINTYYQSMLGHDPVLLDVILKNQELFSLSHVPLYAFMIVDLIQFKNDTVCNHSHTVTEMYIHIFRLAVKKHGNKKNKQIDKYLKEMKGQVYRLMENAFNATMQKCLNLPDISSDETDVCHAFAMIGSEQIVLISAVFQSPDDWNIDLSQRKSSVLLEVLKLQAEKKPVELRGCSEEESEMTSFLQCLPYISQLRCGEGLMLKAQAGEGLMLKGQTGEGLMLKTQAGEGLMLKAQAGEGLMLKAQAGEGLMLKAQAGEGLMLKAQAGEGLMLKAQAGEGLMLKAQAGEGLMLKGQTGEGLMLKTQAGEGLMLKAQAGEGLMLKAQAGEGLMLKAQAGEGLMLKAQAGEGLMLKAQAGEGLMLKAQAGEGLMLKGQTGEGLMFRFIDEKETRMSAVKLLLDLCVAAVENDTNSGTRFLTLLSSVCSYEIFPFAEWDQYYASDQSDFLLDLYSHVKNYETQTGRSFLPALQSVFQLRDDWNIDLSQRKSSVLLEVLKLQTEKKPVVLIGCSEEESEMISFLQCLPYISQLSFWSIDDKETRMSAVKFLLNLCVAAVENDTNTGTRFPTLLSSVCSYHTFPFPEWDDDYNADDQSDFLLDLCSRVKNYETQTGRSFLPALQSVFQLRDDWNIDLSQRKSSVLLEVLKLQTEKKPVELRGCSEEENEIMSFLQCLPYISQLRPSKETLQKLVECVCEAQEEELTQCFLQKVGGDLTSCSLNWEELHYFLQHKIQRIAVDLRKSNIQCSISEILPFLNRIQFKRMSSSLMLSVIREIYESGSVGFVSGLLSSVENYINLQSRELDSVHCAALRFTLQHCTAVSLNLHWTSIPEEELESILLLFTHVSHLSVDRLLLLKMLHCCSVSDVQQEAAAVLLSILQHELDFSCLSALDLTTNTDLEPLHLTADDCRVTSRVIQRAHSDTKTQLILQDCEINTAGMDQLFPVLHSVQLCCAKSLLLQFLAHVRREEAESLSRALGEELDLSQTQLDPQVYRGLELILEYSEGLTELDLSQCRLTDDSLDLLLPNLHKAQNIDFSGNSITDFGALKIYFIVTLKSNIKTVRLFNNRIEFKEPFSTDPRFEIW
ncbi:uncharacterized protein [Sinocyclocheilus grahami]|uniref:uncharacterized protein n=1 Tax=Sinocyclocheilus grahami TaxID=75366 RepID=UPI0007AC6339|nr:PREDICTED: uncharacterized protein LOC107576129 [Sinocyclocheilus grahami]